MDMVRIIWSALARHVQFFARHTARMCIPDICHNL